MDTKSKCLIGSLLLLGFNSFALADSDVMVPSQEGGFKVGIDVLYLRPTNSDLDYATHISFPGNFAAGLERNAAVDPSYDWGFYAQIGYLFPCTANDLTLGYTYLRSEETDSVIAGNPVLATGPVVGILPVGSGAIFPGGFNFNDAGSKVNFDLNAVDLEGGQRFTTDGYDMRMFAGVRYATIDHDLKAVGGPFATAAQGANTNTIGLQEFESEYRGIGPRLGIDGRYCLNSGFGIDANLSTALLVGTLDSRYRAIRTIPSGTRGAGLEATNGSRTRVVPVLEAKLGIDCIHIIDCCRQSLIVFEAGYQVTNYFNVVDRPRVLNSPQGAGLATAGAQFVYQNTTSDVAFDGPYLGVKYYA